MDKVRTGFLDDRLLAKLPDLYDPTRKATPVPAAKQTTPATMKKMVDEIVHGGSDGEE